jgi:hypothetical protein
MNKLKIHLRIPQQVKERVYSKMKALCGNKQAKRFDVSAKQNYATCKRCLSK